MSIIRKLHAVEFKTKVVREMLREKKALSQIASEYGTYTNEISDGGTRRWQQHCQQLSAIN